MGGDHAEQPRCGSGHDPASARINKARGMNESMTRKKILIVEDETEIREIFSRTLRQAGYEVQEAGHALGAVCAMVRTGADLVLTDIRMPIMDGLALVRELKAHEDTRRVPIVAITGHDTPENRAAAFDAGCVGYLTKPIDSDEFLKLIARFLPASP
jgi:CheY-like chemotaxis protein